MSPARKALRGVCRWLLSGQGASCVLVVAVALWCGQAEACEALPGWDGPPTCVTYVDEPWRECFSQRPEGITYGCYINDGDRGYFVYIGRRLAPWVKECVKSHELRHVKEGNWHGGRKHASC